MEDSRNNIINISDDDGKNKINNEYNNKVYGSKVGTLGDMLGFAPVNKTSLEAMSWNNRFNYGSKPGVTIEMMKTYKISHK